MAKDEHEDDEIALLSRLQAKVEDTEKLLKRYSAAAESPLHRGQVLLTHIDAALTIGALLHKLDGNEHLTEVAFKAEHTMFQQYTVKVKKAVGRQELSNQRKKTEVNVDAMHRFIEHAIPDLDQDQKHQLKQVAQAAEANRDGTAHQSLLVNPNKRSHRENIQAAKGLSAAERVQQRRLKQDRGTDKRMNDFLQNILGVDDEPAPKDEDPSTVE